MRDPKRIKKLLKEIETIWMKYPDLRFFQLLINVFRLDENPYFYYLEDDKIIEELKQYYLQISKDTNNKKRRSK
jgi:uncharacterized protein YihD (DUF1040 family)